MTYLNSRQVRSPFVRFVSSGLLVVQAAIGTAAISEFVATLPGVSPSHAAHAQDGGGSADAIYRKAAPAVAYIRAELSDGYSTGSGVLIDANGLIITNAHVIAGSKKITVELHDGRKFEAKVVSQGHKNCLDLALLKIEGSNLPKVNFSKVDSLQKGERVFAIGYPQGIQPSAITQGIVSNVYLEPGMIQTDTTLIPGNSGGALLNDRGELVGINTLKGMDTQAGMNFAITSDKVQDLLLALKQGASPAIGQYLIPPRLSTNVALMQPLQLGSDPVSDRLRSGSIQACGDGSRVNLYTFQGNAYQPVMLSMSSTEIGSYLVLLGPNGERVATSNVRDRNQLARILQTLPATGTYTLLANAAKPDEIEIVWPDGTRQKVDSVSVDQTTVITENR